LNLGLKKSEFTCLVGPNGVGKSTLLRTLAGLQPALSGEIFLGGSSLKSFNPQQLAKELSVVLTETVNVGEMNVFSVVALGRHPYTNWMGKLEQSDAKVILDSLKAVDAEKLVDRSFSELSDGERQKVLIARALAQEPAIILLDEPTAYLDLPHRVIMFRVLQHLAHSLGKAVLVSTHDLDLALHSADVLWLMSEGGKCKVGAPEDLILSTAFEHTFEHQGVKFDPRTGTFPISPHPQKALGLSGPGGITKLWTSRALARVGYEVTYTDLPKELHVEIRTEGGENRWLIHTPTGSVECRSIYEMIKLLNPSD
jgi:iron complex transport system ATP-binding protein